MTKSQYIINNVNKLSTGQKEVISRMIIFREYSLNQTNNGAYANIDLLNGDIINDIYDFMVSCVK